LVGDATKVDLRGVDVVTAGFPCQGLSAAASTRQHGGLFDPESMSYVVWQVLDRIAEANPKYLLLENADSLMSKRYAADLDALLSMLVAHGYHPNVVRLNAGCYGSNMRRVRTFILCRREFWLAPPVDDEIRWRCNAEAIGVNNMQGGATFCVQPSPTKKAAMYNIMVTPDDVRYLTPNGLEVLFGLPVNWTLPADSDQQRYQRLGNAVSVHAARAALELLVKGKTRTRTPEEPYANLLEHTRPAQGGTAGSAVGRIVRDIETKRGGVNRIELKYCLPVYFNHLCRHPETVTDKMFDYVRRLLDLLSSRPTPAAWPKTTEVVMEQ
jgi:site-specific DNA-cytosine methylase